MYAFINPGSLSLTETSPPQSFVEPLTIDEVINFLRLPPAFANDSAVSAELRGYISAAREQSEIAQGRDLVVKQWDLTLDYWPGDSITLRPNVRSVDLVQYRADTNTVTSLVAGTDYIADLAKHPALIAPPYNQIWRNFTPWASSAILVRFTAGMPSTSSFWSDAGARVKVGMLILVKSWFNRESLTGPAADRLDMLLRQGSVSRVF